MRRLLESFAFNRKVYNRPQDEWECGRAAEGCPCVFGPGAKGECRASSQCLPSRQGDRWNCTRPASLGGPCAQGPGPDGACGCPVPPCSPRRSLRSLRTRLTWLGVSLTAGLVGLVFVGNHGDAWTEPGPLTAQHALSTPRCADCHVESGGLVLSSDARARRNAEHDQLCLKCHDLGPQGAAPHGANAALLAELGRAQQPPTGKTPLLLSAAAPLAPDQHAVACAACHSEHHGKNFDLKQVADQQCQSCHRSRFASLASGHPEFKDYPYARRTRLHFDHVSHWTKHFAEPKFAATAPTSCAQCHEPGIDGVHMLVRGYEQACASCHGAQIGGEGQAGDKGLVFFRLPAVDVATLEAAGQPVGEWPAYAEGEVTPFMRWMLEGDPSAKAAAEALGSVHLDKLAAATPAQKAAAAQLVWSIKGLMADLITGGQEVLLRRLGPLPAGETRAARRAGQFSADSLLAAQREWLPDLLVEVAAHRRGEKALPRRPAAPVAVVAAPVPASSAAGKAEDADDLLSGPAPAAVAKPAVPASDDLLAEDPKPAPAATSAPTTPVAPAVPPMGDAETRVARGGWYRGTGNFALHYRPGTHADPFLTAWLEATANDASPAAQAIFAQLSDEKAPGLCMKCHTVDRTAQGAVINWYTTRPHPGVVPFTDFKHSRHFILMGDQGCATCHALDTEARYADGFGTNRDPAVFHSNFRPIAKETCANCHKPSAAGDGCLQCHNYHTGTLNVLRDQAAEFRRTPVPAK